MLFLAGTALLWWNEGRAVKTEKMLDEAGNAYVEMPNPDKKDASLEGELVCGTAFANTEDSLADADFGVGAKAISIRRTVEYYQWVEHSQEKKEDKLGGKEVTTTTYTYSKEWTSRPVESGQFKDPAYLLNPWNDESASHTHLFKFSNTIVVTIGVKYDVGEVVLK